MANESDVFRKLDGVSVDSATHLLRVLHELGRGNAPRTSPRDPDRAGTRDLVFDIARVVLTGYEGLLGLQERYFDVVADGIRDLYRPWSSEPVADRERLRLRGKVGDWASGRFRLQNDEDRDVELKLGTSDFTTGHDDRRFPVAVTVRQPNAREALVSDLRLPAGERRVFEVCR